MESVNGFACRTCADVELAKQGIDPAHSERRFSPPAPTPDASNPELGINEPLETGTLGAALNLFA